jgi:GTP-binding protein
MKEPIVAIVGRPNVGKSTLFNRIIRRRQAIVDDEPGVTRDRNYATTDWAGHKFFLVDTGGYLPKSDRILERAVKEQVEIAINEADLIIFMVDVQTGITVTDEELALLLMKSEKEVLLVVNKIDDASGIIELGQFYKLGLGEPVPVSAMTGRQVGDFLDILCQRLIKSTVTPKNENDAIKLAVIGKENVGKSSLVNILLNQQRLIVTDIPGTTRDSIDSQFRYNDRDYLIIDTAGLKKRTKIKENILFYSNLRAHRSIKRCDVVLYMIDAREGISKQDIQILMEASKEQKGIICIFNKWDLVAKDHHTVDKLKKEVKQRLGELDYIPLIFTSVLKKQRLFKMLDLATAVYLERGRRIATSELNKYFQPIFAQKTPPAIQGKEIKINYVTQLNKKTPFFIFYSNYPQLIADHYKRFLENKLREKFGFSGVPIVLLFRRK